METDLREYELSFLLKAENGREALEKAILDNGGKITYREPLKEVRLAYPIQKHETAYFGFGYFQADPIKTQEIRHEVSLRPEVIRFLIITPPVSRKSKESRIQKPVAVTPAIESKTPAISNEALEQKLEEILK